MGDSTFDHKMFRTLMVMFFMGVLAGWYFRQAQEHHTRAVVLLRLSNGVAEWTPSDDGLLRSHTMQQEGESNG